MVVDVESSISAAEYILFTGDVAGEFHHGEGLGSFLSGESEFSNKLVAMSWFGQKVEDFLFGRR